MEKAVFTHRATLIAAALIAIVLSLTSMTAHAATPAYNLSDSDIEIQLSSDGQHFISPTSFTPTYSGKNITPSIKVLRGKVKRELDSKYYTVHYMNNINAGTAYVEVRGNETYDATGSKTVSFRILPIFLSKENMKLSQSSYVYTGEKCEPDVTFELSNGKIVDRELYDVSYSNNVDPGEATVTVKGIRPNATNATTAEIKATFKIEPLDLSKATVTLSQDSYDYDGQEHRPKVSVAYNGKPVSADIFEVSYSNNRQAGTATVRVYGKGNSNGVVGQKQVSFKINDNKLYHDKYDIAKATIKLSQSSCTCRLALPYGDFSYDDPRYDMVEACRPDVTVVNGAGEALSNRSAYEVSYKNNIHVGTASVTVKGKGSYFGSKTVTFKINPRAIKKCTIRDLICTGKKQKLSVDAGSSVCAGYLKEGRDYSISVSRTPKAVGTYQATITFKGDFSGKVKTAFKILPDRPILMSRQMLSTSKIKVRWCKVKGATGYKVYRWNSSKKKYTLYKTTKSTSCVIKRSGKYDQIIQYKVKAYTKKGRKTYSSSFDEEWCAVKPSRPAFSVRKTGWGAFDVRFKGTGFYQVQVSSNKDFRKGYGEYVITQRNKGWTRSTLSFDGFGTAEKVYIRARAYQSYSNKVLVSPWSATKSCTVY